MSSLTTVADYSTPGLGLARKTVGVVVLAGLADWLFYGHPLGISIALFFVAVALVAAAANPIRATSRETLIALAVLMAGLAPLVMGTNLLAALFGVMATAYAALVMTSPDRAQWCARIEQSFWLIVDASWQAFSDIDSMLQQWSRSERGSLRTASVIKWLIPLVLTGVFALLFAAANPLIERWFTQFDPRQVLSNLSPLRMLLWALMAVAVWPFIFMRGFSTLRKNIVTEFRATSGSIAPIVHADSHLNASVIVRCLICFNLLFAVQTVLDLTYLWGGAALPDGMTYAAYAHRGAYPLIATALLAAVFVLITMRPATDTERSPLVRTLVFVWTGQNVLLVISSILRLDLYVEIYSLTYLRIAAFIWMGLVAAGLVLIAARIAFGKTNLWLVQVNLAALAVTLYVCCFVNFPRLIADYNVTQELSRNGAALDTDYLFSLGPQVLPGLDRYLQQRNVPPVALRQREALVRGHLNRQASWRSWNYENWELDRYLQKRESR